MSSSVWMLSRAGSQTVFRILILAVLARLLTKTDFGLLSALLVVVHLSDMFATLSMMRSLVQRVEPSPAYVATGFALSMLLSTTVGAVIWVSAPYIAALFRMPELVAPLRAVVVVFPIRGAGLVADALLRREMKFGTIALVGVGSYVIAFGGVGVVLALLGFGVWALVAAFLSQNLLQTAALLLIQPHPKQLPLDWTAVKDLVYFGGGLSAGGMLNFVALNADNFVIGRFMGAAALGIYGRAYNLMATGVSVFAGTLDEVIFPVFARIQEDRRRVSDAFLRLVGLSSLFSMPASAILCVTAPEIVVTIMGPRWADVVLPFQILSVGMMFRMGQKAGAAVSVALGAVYENTARAAIYALAVVAGAMIGRQWGIPGVAAGVACALALNFAMMYGLIMRLTGTRLIDLVTAHLPGIGLALGTGVTALAVTFALRVVSSSPVLRLLGVLGAEVLLLLALLRLAPHLFGRDAAWLVQQLQRLLPPHGPLSALRRWASMSPR